MAQMLQYRSQHVIIPNKAFMYHSYDAEPGDQWMGNFKADADITAGLLPHIPRKPLEAAVGTRPADWRCQWHPIASILWRLWSSDTPPCHASHVRFVML